MSTADDRHALDRLLEAHSERTTPPDAVVTVAAAAARSAKHAVTEQLRAVAIPVLRAAVASLMHGEYSARLEDDTSDDGQPQLSVTMRPGAVDDMGTPSAPFHHTSALRLRPTGAGTVDVWYEIAGAGVGGSMRETNVRTFASPIEEADVRAAVYDFVNTVISRE